MCVCVCVHACVCIVMCMLIIKCVSYRRSFYQYTLILVALIERNAGDGIRTHYAKLGWCSVRVRTYLSMFSGRVLISCYL